MENPGRSHTNAVWLQGLRLFIRSDVDRKSIHIIQHSEVELGGPGRY
jgi:hypothetical protein